MPDVKRQAQPDQLLPTSSIAMKPDDRPIRVPLLAKRKPGRQKMDRMQARMANQLVDRGKSQLIDSLSTNEVLSLCVLLMLTPKRCFPVLVTTAGTHDNSG